MTLSRLLAARQQYPNCGSDAVNHSGFEGLPGSIPTAPTSLLILYKGLAKSARQQKAAIRAKSVGQWQMRLAVRMASRRINPRTRLFMVVRMQKENMRIPRCARGNAESEKMVFRQTEIICMSFIYKCERTRRISKPGVRRDYVQSRSQLCLKDLFRFGLVSWREAMAGILAPRKSARVTIGSFKRLVRVIGELKNPLVR